MLFLSGFTKHGPFSEHDNVSRVLDFCIGSNEIGLPRKSPTIDEQPGPPSNLVSLRIMVAFSATVNEPQCERGSFWRSSRLKEPEPLEARSVAHNKLYLGQKILTIDMFVPTST